MAYARLIGLVFLLAIMGGVVYNQFRTTNKVIIGAGGRQVIVNTDSPRQSLFNFGCANLQTEIFWKKGSRFPSFAPGKEKNVSQTSNRIGS